MPKRFVFVHSLYIDTISEKLKIQSFKDNILQNLHENIIEIFDAELNNFKAQYEDLVKKVMCFLCIICVF